MAAALLNSTFIQGFELDDYHSEAPIHSSSLVLPVLFATIEHLSRPGEDGSILPMDGASFLTAVIAGYEVGPRIGLGLYGMDVLSKGWHSGAIFGPVSAAVAASKLMQSPKAMIEDAIGIACTQAGGLMSAQFESMVKRMQHGFAARNGLFAAFMARSNYTGIKRVLERPYGGFLSNFSQGSERSPRYRPDLITNQLGQSWEIDRIIVKPYASMAGTHPAIDCVRGLQSEYPDRFGAAELEHIRAITIELSEPGFQKGGWKPQWPITITGAQMSASFAVALQLVDGEVLPDQFLAPSSLDRQIIWSLLDKTTCKHNPDFDKEQKMRWFQRVSVQFRDGSVVSKLVEAPRGISPPYSNREILEKWRKTTEGILAPATKQMIEDAVLGLENLGSVKELTKLLFSVGAISSRL